MVAVVAGIDGHKAKEPFWSVVPQEPPRDGVSSAASSEPRTPEAMLTSRPWLDRPAFQQYKAGRSMYVGRIPSVLWGKFLQHLFYGLQRLPGLKPHCAECAETWEVLFVEDLPDVAPPWGRVR
jgi:hypothetical protein